MRYSKLFGKTVRESLRGTVNTSTDLLYRGGFIRESTAGRYFLLPLGWRVHKKIEAIIRQEMDRAGAQEMLSPVLHPLELWQETNRTNTTGFELMRIKDRREAEFALGGTAEEMFVDVVRKFQISYKDLPFNIYQFSMKFRDELRARGGLLRVREFLMKDAYSFDRNEEEFKKEYEKMANTYTTIFKRMGLSTYKVEADNGYIGGEYCHEYVVETESGESRFLMTEDGSYCAHEDVAVFVKENMNAEEEMKPYAEVDAVRGKTMEDGVKLHGLPLWQQLKDVMYKDRNGKLYLAIIRGDMTVNEAKLLHLSGADYLEPANDEDIIKIGSYPGFISPVGLEDKVIIVADDSLRTVKNLYGGANKKHRDALNMNIGRDFKPHTEGDIAVARAGDKTKDGKVLLEKKGSEVGNIFQLGYHYTRLMKGAEYTDEDGKKKPYYMGCYGIGVGRTLATIVEKYHDDKGIVWPEEAAPFQVHLVSLKDNNSGLKIYEQLQKAQIDVLWDDTNRSAGEKFADADLIGIPVRLVVSQKTGEKIEYKSRRETECKLMTINEVLNMLR